MSECLFGDLHLRQNHRVIVAEVHSPDGLGEDEATAIPDVVHFEIDPWREGQTAHMEAVAAMVDRVSEKYLHRGLYSSYESWDLIPIKFAVSTPVGPTGVPVPVTKKIEKMQI